MIFFEKANSCIKFPLTKKAIFIKNKNPYRNWNDGMFLAKWTCRSEHKPKSYQISLERAQQSPIFWISMGVFILDKDCFIGERKFDTAVVFLKKIISFKNFNIQKNRNI